MEKSPSPSIAFDSQVGGHGGILSSSDGAVIIKPCLPLEIDFYKTLLSNEEAYGQLATIVPQFYGTLSLHGRLDENGDIVEGHTLLPDSETEKDEPYTFSKPNVIDIKLGTILWGEDASPEKRLRMEKTARATTSYETGIRITGFNIYDYTEGRVVHTDKAYGKSLKMQDLPTAISKCFPLAMSDFPQGQGLQKDLLKRILEGIVIEIQIIINILSRIDFCMAGVSLLIVYEADWDILRQTLQDWPSKDNVPILTHEEEEEEEEGEQTGVEDSLNEGDSNGSEESEESEDTRVPFVVKLIDFAHTSLEKKHDTGIIHGLETTIELLTGRLKEILDIPL